MLPLRAWPTESWESMSYDNGLVCDCGKRKGWAGLAEQPLDGDNWTVEVAAKWLGLPARDIRDLIRVTGLEPTGTAKMAAYRRSGRQPRVYDAKALIQMYETVYELRQVLGTQDPG
jgi:hypothetical protein